MPKFESQNNISINVYILKKKKRGFKILPSYLTKKKLKKQINLLMIQNNYCIEDDSDDTEDYETEPTIQYHFVWIRNLSRLLSTQLSKMHGKKYICDRCLHYFYTQNGLDKHTIDCVNQNSCKIRLPINDLKHVTFKNFKNKEKAPFIIYSDLECKLSPINEISSNKYQEHIPHSIGYYVKCIYDKTL